MNSIILGAHRRRILVFVMLVGVFVGSAVAFINLNIEAYPDPVPPLGDIIVQSPGQSAATGFVALFGIAAMDRIIGLTFYNSAVESGLDRASHWHSS